MLSLDKFLSLKKINQVGNIYIFKAIGFFFVPNIYKIPIAANMLTARKFYFKNMCVYGEEIVFVLSKGRYFKIVQFRNIFTYFAYYEQYGGKVHCSLYN